MPIAPPIAALLDASGLSWEADAPLAKRAWWRVGGPAAALVTVQSPLELARLQGIAHATGDPVVALGAGSNLLIADRGIPGLVAVLAGELADSEERGDGVVVVGGGMRLAVLLARAARAGWAGLEGLAGIPGTVGGAVKMNAGTSLGEIGDRVLWADVVLSDGGQARIHAAELHFAYRSTRLPPGAIVARVALRTDGDAEASRTRMVDFLARRKQTQPLDQPSCGSTFTNPPGDAAGRLIEASGLKGYAVGGAQVSAKHANFVVNTGGATAQDIARVIAHVRAEVFRQQGVPLHPEVVVVGDWGPEGCPLDEASA